MSNKEKSKKLHAIITIFSYLTCVLWNSFFSDTIITYVLWGIATIVVIYLFYLDFGKRGCFIGTLICFLLIGVTYFYLNKDGKKANSIIKNADKGDIYINLNKIDLEYGNSHLATKIVFNKDSVKKFSLVNSDKKATIYNYQVKNNCIVVRNVPKGNYNLTLSLLDYKDYTDSISFSNKEKSNGKWKLNLFLQSNVEYKNFNVFIRDSANNLIRDAQCTLQINNDKEVKNIKSNSTGKLPYTLVAPIDTEVKVTMAYEGTKYSKDKEYYNLLFDVQKKESSKELEASEIHTPDDQSTIVSLTNWDSSSDIGIDGKKYNGLKCAISDMFISMGSNGSKKVISRITIPVDNLNDNTIFSGFFVLDQSMFGSKSHGNIKIIVNGQDVFNTDITTENNNAIPFNIDFTGSDTIIIEITAYLESSDFVLGIVSKH
mgnify:CR=1 FL=1